MASRLAMLWLGLQPPQRLVLLLAAIPLLLATLPTTLPTLSIMLAGAGAAVTAALGLLGQPSLALQLKLHCHQRLAL